MEDNVSGESRDEGRKMRYLKTGGLVVLAALALTILAGAGTASATELCTTNVFGAACPGISLHSTGSELEFTTTQWTLTAGGLGKITCTDSLFKGKTTSKGGPGLEIGASIESSTLTGKEANGDCTLETPFTGTHPCTMSVINLPWKAAIDISAQPNGTIVLTNGGKGEPGFTANCPAANTLCTFTAQKITLDFDGGKPALVTAKERPLTPSAEKVGGTCPAESSWDSTYTVLKPSPGYLVN
jgi:hypothetical protein